LPLPVRVGKAIILFLPIASEQVNVFPLTDPEPITTVAGFKVPVIFIPF
jgi:hypothetical protein